MVNHSETVVSGPTDGRVDRDQNGDRISARLDQNSPVKARQVAKISRTRGPDILEAVPKDDVRGSASALAYLDRLPRIIISGRPE